VSATVLAVALLIGTIELVSVLHDDLGLEDPLTSWVSAIDLNDVGFAIVGLFVLPWLCAVTYWKAAGVEKRWQTTPSGDAR
jgi:nickel/cobalt transporter (NiCoT) family protein